MPQNLYDLSGTQTRTLQCTPHGKKLETDRDAVELLGEALQCGASLVMIPVERFGHKFFRLRRPIQPAGTTSHSRER